MTLSGWNDIRKFGTLFFFILRKPVTHTIQVFKKIEPRDSFKFFVQSFVIFTIITSLFTAFRGNDILKSILQMLNQIFSLTLSTLLYFLIFNSISKIKRNFTEFLVLYSLYMGFILPFFAIGSYLNWQLLLMGNDPTLKLAGPNPIKFILIILGDLIFTGFGIYYSYRIIRYLWNIHFGLIFLGMGLVFALLTPVQMLWIQMQCKVGITPDFEFNNPAHRKATLSLLGCTDISCRSCLLVGQWKYADLTIEKYSQLLRNKNVTNEEFARNTAMVKSRVMNFREDGRFIVQYIDKDLIPQQNSATWFFSEDGKKIFFDETGYEIIILSKDFVSLKYETLTPGLLYITYDTMYLRPIN